jgi:hypothetical protein
LKGVSGGRGKGKSGGSRTPAENGEQATQDNTKSGINSRTQTENGEQAIKDNTKIIRPGTVDGNVSDSQQGTNCCTTALVILVFFFCMAACAKGALLDHNHYQPL